MLEAQDAEIEKLGTAVDAHAADHGETASTGGYRDLASMVMLAVVLGLF
jgi:hypothetical protein